MTTDWLRCAGLRRGSFLRVAVGWAVFEAVGGAAVATLLIKLFFFLESLTSLSVHVCVLK